MPKFFVEPNKVINDKIIIDTDDVGHIVKALRYREGDEITVCDGEKNDYLCRIADVSKSEIICDIVEKWENEAESTVKTVLCLALPKGDKSDFVIQKSVELGVSEIIMFEAENSVAKASSDKRAEEKKLSKWQKTALEAAKQCGRGIIPRVIGIYSYEKALSEALKCDKQLFFYEKEKSGKIDDISWDGISSVSYFIGPEGGFSQNEVDFAQKSGVDMITLGKRILRLETAAVTAAAIIMHTTHNL